jgi:DNA modification methylase
MLSTNHKIFYSDARNLSQIPSEQVNLMVTSPPYPMIQMWDELFSSFNGKIKEELIYGNGLAAFELMHQELDKVWNEVYRVLRQGCIACINIGDATRSINNNFQLYSNHSRIISHCLKIGFSVLPVILWRKQTNAPNKFMGSGMLPVGAYVTLEHEYIIILRKGKKREFTSPLDKLNRQQSSFFWEERNSWFSDIWDFKGARQELNNKELRKRSAAFPFELAYRLINMYSVKGDTVLDPFLGTGTTLFAAIASCRNSIGVEIDNNFYEHNNEELFKITPICNFFIEERLLQHVDFIKNYPKTKKDLKYKNKYYDFPVKTKPETEIYFNLINNIEAKNNIISATYQEKTKKEK